MFFIRERLLGGSSRGDKKRASELRNAEKSQKKALWD